MPIRYYALLAVWLATHALVGSVLGAVLFDRPKLGIVGAIWPDLDYLFPAAFGWPFVHRGITHTILAVIIATAVVVALNRGFGSGLADVVRSKTGGAFAIASLSHLLIDVTTPKGVPLFYPVLGHPVTLDLPTTGHSLLPTVLLWIGSLGVLYWAGRVPRLRDRLFEGDDSG